MKLTDVKTKYVVLILFFIPLFISIAVEFINKQDIVEVFLWAGENFEYFMIGVLIIAALFFLGLGIFNNVLVSFLLLFSTYFLLTSVSYFKMIARGEPLYASDLSMTFEIASVTDKSNFVFTNYFYIALVFAFIFVCVIIYLNLQKIKLDFIHRFAVSTMGFFLILVIYYSNVFSTNIWNDFTYNKKGFSVGFLSNIQYCLADEAFNVGSPKYTQKYLEDILLNIKGKFPAKYQTEPVKKNPNVIVVMSESFYDISRLENLQLSDEPIPNFKSLAQNHTNGNMVSITFGGGTANVEYEFLTGFLNKNFSVIYSSYETTVNRPIMSLASIFKEKGYDTVALHTFRKSFYERDRVYPLLGFDRFVGLEDLENPKYNGTYVADEELTNMIINEYENKENEEPVFIFAVSMENHQPFNEEKYENNPIKVLNMNLGTELKSSVEAYVHGLNEADLQLKRLVDYFDQQEEETCILFFGDHLPTLGPNFQLYKKLGAIESSQSFEPIELKNILSTQFLLWSNFKQENLYVDTIGANFLGNYLLDYLETPKPVFYHFIDMVHQDLNYMSRTDFVIDSQGQLYNAMPEQDKSLDELYRLLQYDMLLGEDYITEGLKELR